MSPFGVLRRIRVMELPLELGGTIGILRPSQSRIERLGAWFEVEYPRLLRFAYFLTADPATAEDLVQEAFVRIYRAGGRVEAPEFNGYARRTLLNLSRSAQRRLRREKSALPRLATSGNLADPSELADRSDVRGALLALSPTQRACLAMRFYEDMKEQDIAAALDMSLSAVKKNVERGLTALRIKLADRSTR